MKYLVLGNWKSNGTQAMVEYFADNFQMPSSAPALGMVSGLALPFHLLGNAEVLADLWQGAQNVSQFGEGAYTGEITAGMIHTTGCRFALVGHSERRAIFGESVDATAKKLARLLAQDIYPVFCIGETLEQRQAGKLEAVLEEQLKPFADVAADAAFAIAYEPVWAIGTGVAASPEDARDAHAIVKRLLAAHGFQSVPVLYGGSVKPANAEVLSQMDGIDGFLVGGASLKPEDLGAIAAGFCAGKA